jgi:hypothetical protein
MSASDASTDIVEIREVLARYMRAMRLGDVDLMDDVFLPDSVIDYTAIGGSVSAWTETKPWLQGMIAVELFMLFVGDVYVTFDADGIGADVESSWHGAFVATADTPPLTIFGTYDDRFVRTPDGWRIEARKDNPMLQIPGPPPVPAE